MVEKIIGKYLIKQNHRNDPIGDLARDFIDSGDECPSDDLDSWELYLGRRGACSLAYEALKALFIELGYIEDDEDE